MVDINDPEVIESLKYLLVPKEERIRMSAMPFDAKKQCFVPHKTEAFVTALIEKEDEKKGTVSVVLEDGSVSSLTRLSSYLSSDSPNSITFWKFLMLNKAIHFDSDKCKKCSKRRKHTNYKKSLN